MMDESDLDNAGRFLSLEGIRRAAFPNTPIIWNPNFFYALKKPKILTSDKEQNQSKCENDLTFGKGFDNVSHCYKSCRAILYFKSKGFVFVN